MRLIKRGPYFYAYHEKRKISLRTKDRGIAEQRIADLEKQIDHQAQTVTDIMELYLAEKDQTAKAAKRLREAWVPLKPFFGNLRDDQITKPLCRRYAAERGRAPGTINKELRTLRAGVRWYDPNTKAQFEFLPNTPPKDRRLTRDEYKKLRDSAIMPHVRAFIILALGTAARKGAILDLTWDRVDLENGIIVLSTGEEGRKGRATVPMTSSVRDCLQELKEASLTDYVIEWAGGPVKSIKKGFTNAVEKSGVDCTPHVLRHTAACWMAEAGTPMSEIAQYLGHSDSRITERVYARYSPSYLSGAAKALDV